MNVQQMMGLAAVARTSWRGLLSGDDAGHLGPLPGSPIILIHGFASPSSSLLPLERHLRRRLGRPVVRLRLGERLPLHVQDIRKSAQAVERALTRLAQHPDFEYADIVGHSMGGLVAAYVLKHLDRGRRVRRVVTLGTPHHGTPLAVFGILIFGTLSRALWQMRPGSSFLRDLDERPVPDGCDLVAVAANDDIIVPARYARVTEGPRQYNEAVVAANHWGLVTSSIALESVVSLLTREADIYVSPLRAAA